MLLIEIYILYSSSIYLGFFFCRPFELSVGLLEMIFGVKLMKLRQ